jgi:hypothetical protein
MIIRNQCPNFGYPGYECTENGTASDVTYITDAQLLQLREWLEMNLTEEQLERIVEVVIELGD